MPTFASATKASGQIKSMIGLGEHARTKLDQQTKQVENASGVNVRSTPLEINCRGGEIQMRIAEPVEHY